MYYIPKQTSANYRTLQLPRSVHVKILSVQYQEVDTSNIQKVADVFRPIHSLVCTDCDLNNFFSYSKNETLREKKFWNDFFPNITLDAIESE